VRGALPRTPAVACFDTAFHATLPPEAATYAVPRAWRERWGARRYGFHGLSVEWSVGRAAAMLGRPVGELGLVVAHLGGGCSVTAVEGGRSVRTSMGYTPLEGLMMGTRSGSIDPGLMLRLLADGRLSVAAMSDALEHGSGLLGASGISGDLRDVEAAAGRGDDRARMAIEMFVGRTAGALAWAASALRRLDGVVFTGGIGEHGATVRAAIARRLTVLGVPAVPEADDGTDAILAREPGRPTVLRIEAREDLVMAAAAKRLISG
jgi:acetate kinase